MTNKQISKIIQKALKNANKEMYYNKHFLGRFEVCDSLHQVEKTLNKGLLKLYHFKCIDKETNEKRFFTFDTTEIFSEKEITIKFFETKFRNILNRFSLNHSIEWTVNWCGKQVKKNYRRIKID